MTKIHVSGVKNQNTEGHVQTFQQEEAYKSYCEKRVCLKREIQFNSKEYDYICS